MYFKSYWSKYYWYYRTKINTRNDPQTSTKSITNQKIYNVQWPATSQKKKKAQQLNKKFETARDNLKQSWNQSTTTLNDPQLPRALNKVGEAWGLCVSGGEKCYLFGKFGVRTKWLILRLCEQFQLKNPRESKRSWFLGQFSKFALRLLLRTIFITAAHISDEKILHK